MEFISLVIYASIYIGLVAASFLILSYFYDTRKKKLLFSDDELPFVSVIIPAFNEEKSIKRTLDSILACEYKGGFEVIFVDDGSKDKTLEIAKKFESKFVKVFHKENGGKASALNYGVKKAKGDLIFSMDADTFVAPNSLDLMTRYFKNEQVMAVTGAMLVHKPRSFLQYIQYAEYALGVFLRKAFAGVNSVYITPGAFSAYRKSFFSKYGGWNEGNITEDLELALRIHYRGYVIENCPDALIYTIAPTSFRALCIQRRRWYYGLIKNLIHYKELLSRKYGDMGLFIMPVAWISIFFSVFVTVYFFIKNAFDIRQHILFLNSINFDFTNAFSFNSYFIERIVFLFFTNPIVIFVFVFAFLMGSYMVYTSRRTKEWGSSVVSLVLFFIFFAILFGFWWIVSLVYLFLNKGVKWR